MNTQFDVVVIGAGPCAIAALNALDGQPKIAAVTGHGDEIHARASLHPKIHAVSGEHREPPGIAAAVARDFAPGKPLFATAIIGGLANYWGQQCVRYTAADIAKLQFFPDYQSYLNDCEAVEQIFSFSGGTVLPSSSVLPAEFHCLTPRLLTGTAASPALGLKSMRTAFALQPKSAQFNTRALNLSRQGTLWRVTLATGEVISAPRILLAAGVLGTAQLLLQSFDHLQSASFSDHAPWMLYTIGLARLKALRPKGEIKHFNALTIEKRVDDEVKIFASLYDMGRAEFNLLLASTIGRTSSWLRGILAPPGSGLLEPVQIWTDRSFATLHLTRNFRLSAPLHDGADPRLADACAMLRNAGGKILHTSRTTPGYGFHYHGLSFTMASHAQTGIASALQELTGGSVQCVDSSILPTIGLRPHTLTAMAAARRRVLSL